MRSEVQHTCAKKFHVLDSTVQLHPHLPSPDSNAGSGCKFLPAARTYSTSLVILVRESKGDGMGGVALRELRKTAIFTPVRVGRRVPHRLSFGHYCTVLRRRRDAKGEHTKGNLERHWERESAQGRSNCRRIVPTEDSRRLRGCGYGSGFLVRREVLHV